MKKIACCILLISSSALLTASANSQQIEISLTWSTDTYVPVSYYGKALPVKNSNIEVIANIDSFNGNIQNLTYNWYLNDLIQKEDSGPERQTFKFNAGERSNYKYSVEVKITNGQGNIVGISSRLPIKIIEPQITVLPLSGLFAEEYQIPANQEAKFIAQPYFFNIQNINDLEYDWKFGQEIISQKDTKNPNILALKIGEVVKTISQKLNLSVENKINSSQRAQNNITITLIP